MIDSAALDFLTSPAGDALLAELRVAPLGEHDILPLLTHLRARYTPAQAAAAVELTQLRRRAAAKFTRAAQMFFTRDALEQSSGEVIARYRAPRFAQGARVSELGCGIGGDTLALAARGPVDAYERDELRLRMAALNARAYEVHDQINFVQADFTHDEWRAADALFMDPARRRATGERVFSVHAYAPPLTIVPPLLARVPHAGIKISPGVRYAELEAMGLDCELEFISEEGTCKEGVLWFGALRSEARRRATLLPSGDTLKDDGADTRVPSAPPLRYLYDPDAAVVRAHLIETLARREGFTKIDDEIAYLSADQLVQTPFARAFAIEEWHPFNLKKLNERLRALDVGRVTLMKRGSPIEPDQFVKRLRLTGKQERIVVFTRALGQPIMLICTRAAA